MGVLLTSAERASTVTRDTKVFDVVREMSERGVAAALVTHDDRPIGIFTLRDLMTRVVLRDLDAKTTTVGAVMTPTVLTVSPDTTPAEAKQTMLDRRVRHLPVVGADGRILGVVTMRRLLEEEADVLRSEATGLANYAAYDDSTG